MNIKQAVEWSIKFPLFIIIPVLTLLFLNAAFYASIPAWAPLGRLVLFIVSGLILFPWEFLSTVLGVCRSCDNETAVFVVCVLSLFISVFFYACIGFLLGLLRHYITISVHGRNKIEFDITHKKTAIGIIILLCVLFSLIIYGWYLNQISL